MNKGTAFIAKTVVSLLPSVIAKSLAELRHAFWVETVGQGPGVRETGSAFGCFLRSEGRFA